MISMFAMLLIAGCGGSDINSDRDREGNFRDFGLFEITPVRSQQAGEANEGYFYVATYRLTNYPYQGNTGSGENCYLTEEDKITRISENTYARASDRGTFSFTPDYFLPDVPPEMYEFGIYHSVLTINAADKYDIDNDGNTTELVDTYHREVVSFDASDVPACV